MIIPKARDKLTKYVIQIKQIEDELGLGVVHREHDTIKERWKGYFCELLNKENPITVGHRNGNATRGDG